MEKSKTYWGDKLQTLQDELTQLEQDSKTGRDAVELDQTKVGRLSRIDAMQAQAMNNAVSQRRKQALSRIKAAFKRLEEDEFGYCLKCGDEIRPKRLELDPTSLYCAPCSR